jgi:hypothetical protein
VFHQPHALANLLVLGGGLRQFEGWLQSTSPLCLPTTFPDTTSAMLTEHEFYEKWHKFFCKYNNQGKVQYPEEDESDKVALVVIDDMTIEITKCLTIDLYI